jgi:nucleoid-associated protein YgaU
MTAMKLRTKSRLKGILIPAIAAFFLGVGAIACSSSGEEGSPDPTMTEEGNVTNSDPLANEANGNAETDEGEAVNGEGGNEELTNLVNEGSGNAAAAENPAADPGLNNAGSDPFANPAEGAAAEAPMEGGNDPFASANGTGSQDPSAATEPAVDVASTPTENPALAGAAPMNPAADPMATEAAPMTPENPAALEAAAPVSNAPMNAAPVAEQPAPIANGSAVAAAAGGYLPENGSKMAYYVQKGDTLGTIAQKIYGKKSRWKELAQANNLQDPNRIYAGDVVLYTLDDSSRGFADKYESSGRQSVTVAAGDTLSKISAKIYGSEGAWRTLWKENPEVRNPDSIRPGMVLFYRAPSATAFEQDSAPTEDELEAVAEVQME